MEDLWKAPYKLFFPEGLEDPELALIHVSVHSAEYWSGHSTVVGRLVHFAKAYAKHDIHELGNTARSLR